MSRVRFAQTIRGLAFRALGAGSWSLVLLLFLALPAWAVPPKHYEIVLPAGYTGWVQVIFGDPKAPALEHNTHTGGYVIAATDSGLVRTSDRRLHDRHTAPQLFYWNYGGPPPYLDNPVPGEDFLHDDALGGFGTPDPGDRGGQGYSWFFYVGPPGARAREPGADFQRDAQRWHREHGNYHLGFNGRYPVPGRVRSPYP